jgi:polar amino acid transport system substrate-binding protein
MPSGSQETYPVPQFRHVDPAVKAPDLTGVGEVRLLADADFPPFSYDAGQGKVAGIAVDLALAACTELRLRCRIVPKPWAELLPALGRDDGDVVIAGPRLNEALLESADPTRPFYRAIGHFIAKRGDDLTATDPVTLSGKRIGVRKETSHAAWLAEFYTGSEITLFDSDKAARDAMLAGQIDLLFGDALSLIYWVKGQASRDCCKLIGAGYSDPASISPPMVFLVRRDKPVLRQAFDYGLDRMQSTGVFAAVFRRYVPLSPW